MDCTTSPWMALRIRFARQRGASIVETVIALPVVLAVILGVVQFALVYEAKATLNHAALQAARLGAVRHADPEALRRGLAQGLAALHTPEASLDAFVRTMERTRQALQTDARIRVLNPTREAFDDFGVEVNGVREIPNDRLAARSTAVGSRSGINIQDANLLKVQVTYGYALHVPLVNWFIARVLLAVRPSDDAFERQLLHRLRLPIVATATVRMQTPARLSEAVMALSEFPQLARVAVGAGASPVSAAPEASHGTQGERADQLPSPGVTLDREGSGLDDAFFGFGSAPADAGGDPLDTSDEDRGGGLNGGNPMQCSLDVSPRSAFPFGERPVIGLGEPGGGVFDLVAADEPSGATLGPVKLASLAVGNPIHVATGNKFQVETDIASLPGMLGLELRRYYNSAAVDDRSAVGAGWRHSYQASLHRRADGAIELVQADGRLIVFERELGQLAGSASRDGAVQLGARRASDGVMLQDEGGYRWLWRSGRVLQFDAEGRLIQIHQRGHVLQLRYDPHGLLSTVIDPQQRTLRFAYYPNGRLATVRGPGEMGIRYTYDSRGNLVQAVSIDGNARRYSYEDQRHPHHLSGISVGSVRPQPLGQRVDFERIARWAYDEQGRAVYSSHPGDAGKVTLSFGAGYTDVTDAFGRTTRYVIGWRDAIAFVSEVQGPGCAPCGQADTRYQYDAHWRLVELATKEAALRYTHDATGRMEQIDRVIGSVAEWLMRFAYEGDSDRVVRFERPSVMAGATYVIELDYDNDALVRVRERGFAPGESGYFGIERSTSLAYDARGRLSSIDGPREDIADSVQFEYDALDRLTVVRTAAGDTRILGYDYAGRPARLARAGRPDIALEYDAHGKLTSFAELHSRRALTTTYTYDSAGRLVQIVDPQGHRILYRFDGAGRPNRLSRTDSEITIAARYASDDRLERIAAFGREGGVLRTLYYAYDADRRLVEVRDGEGPPLRQLVYADADALPDRTIDPLGHETWLSYDAAGRVLTVRAPDGGSTRTEYDAQGRAHSIIAPNGAGASYLFDDFGRRVAERSADRGETRYVYDAADNLVAKIDARGAVTQLRYDAANRLSAVERDEDIATLRYVNGWLTTIDNGSTGEQYGYDRDGQLVEHIRVVGKHRFRTQFAYDELGRLAVRTLPSGTRLRYRYDESGALESITEERWRGDRLLLRSDANGGRSPSRVRSMNMIAGNGLATRTTFDARSGKWIRRKIEGVAELTYELDEADRITSIRNGTQVRHYSYDPAGRISSARSLAGTVTFGYDVNGNRLISTASSVSEEPSVEHGALNLQGAEGSGVSQYTYAPRSNRLVDVDGTVPRVYDAAGNPLRI